MRCAEQFSPSSRHRKCPKCRRQSDKKNACTCGRIKQRESPVCIKCVVRQPQPKGEHSPNWKGGKRHKNGYVVLYRPDHQRSSGGYVFEHVLVMEKHLGKTLEKGENVHHINGVRDDNRIENLELWVRPQPAGIRVNDAIAWAKEILRRYESI